MRTGLNSFQWCPWCGNFVIVMALRKAFDELGIPPTKRVIVSWIGCSWKMSQYIDGYGCETLHGRAIPFATWVKMVVPEMYVVVIAWDGDTYGIGGNHFLHACRRNIPFLCLVANNETYALTTGQASPTTPLGQKTKTTPFGNTTVPFDPFAVARAAGAFFVRSCTTKNMLELKETIKEGLQCNWFAFIDIKQDCPSFKTWE